MNEDDNLWIARDGDGCLFIYSVKPTRTTYCFQADKADPLRCRIPDNRYREVTWENSPQRLVSAELVTDVMMRNAYLRVSLTSAVERINKIVDDFKKKINKSEIPIS
jgi:hypothetical protein